MPYTFKIAA